MAKNFDHLSLIKSSATRDVTSEEFFGLTPTSDNSEDSGSSPIKMNLSKRPTADNLVEGEIAVNYLKGHETLSIKNSEGEIVGFISENEIQENNEILVKGISQEAKDRIDACEAISKKIETHEAESAYQTIEVTMADLYNLKSTEKLKPGNSYRITDYNTKTNTSMTDIRSQEFHYDVIVTATSTTTLSEIAKAAKAKVGSASSQFDDSNLDAWELRFRMGFDKEEFPWAYYSGDTTKYGVVYYMKDEHGNEAPYDFKNIQFKRYKIEADTSVTTGENDWKNNIYAGLESGSYIAGEYGGYGYSGSDSDYNWFYTFSALRVTWDSTNHKFTAPTAFTADSAILDASIANVKNLYNTDTNSNNGCSNNVIKPYYTNGTKHNLNNNIMLGWYGDYSSMESDYKSGTSDPGLTYNLPHDNYFASNCRNNTLSIGSWGNKLGEGCYENVIGNFNASTTDTAYGTTMGKGCYWNAFGNGSYNNKLGDGCYDIVLGNATVNNSFGNDCYSNLIGSSSEGNILGKYCTFNVMDSNFDNNVIGNFFEQNTFGKSCDGNLIGNRFQNNTIGNTCYRNSFGSSCTKNTLGNSCFDNHFGDYCYSNTFDDYCQHNSFGQLCYSNTFSTYNTHNSFGNGCYSNTFSGTRTTYNSFGNLCHDITIGAQSSSNSIGNYCNTITFGSLSNYNKIGNGCNNIKTGTYFVGNTIGNQCYRIYFYSGTSGTTGLNYVENWIVENSNKYITVRTSSTVSASNQLRNYTIAQGVNNTVTNKTVTLTVVQATYKITLQNASSTTQDV